ncbi:MAG: HD domain-containing protein [Candidatus Peregrinibacteria bacterium]|nr:HD domain-containing protein [Candidatus Peregrinibacteria bacterium]
MQWPEFRSHIRHLPTNDQERVHVAFELGKAMHEGQVRKSGEPYFSHPIAVADMLADVGADADTLIAALLHDTLEDTPLTLQDVQREFNGTVPELIDGVTKLNKQDLGEKPTLNEQVETLRKIFTLMQKDVRIMVIKLLDRLHNMQTAEFLPPDKRAALAKETTEIYVRIADRLCMQDIRDELEGLCLSVLDPATFAQLEDLRNENEQHGRRVQKLLRSTVTKDYPEIAASVSLLYEHKAWDRLRAQLLLKGEAATGFSGLTIAFICRDVDTCYRVMGALHQLWQRETMSFQDYINSPRLNGYRGLHTTIILEDGTRVRCKIRTQEMQEYARRGVTTFCFGTQTPEILGQLPWTQRISSLSEDTKEQSEEFWQSLQSDILGESIVIHGPADLTVSVPKGATALDAAFYLFHDASLRLSSVAVNGTTVPFHTSLKHADTVSLTLSNDATVQREWLSWTKTGYAIAMIRRSLGTTKSDGQQEAIGKQMLEVVLRDHRRGFIDEFQVESMLRGIRSLGKSSLPDVYRAIADGHLDPGKVYEAIFEHQHVMEERKRLRTISYRIRMEDGTVMDRMNLVHRAHGDDLREIQYTRGKPDQQSTVVLRANLSAVGLRQFLAELRSAGAENMQVIKPYARLRPAMGIIALVTLWGLDPVIARTLLEGALSAFDLTFMRFAAFFLVMAIAYFSQSYATEQKLKHLSPFNPTLLLCGISLFITGLATYLTLSVIPPTQYILFIVSGVIITLLLRSVSLHHALSRHVISLLAVLGSMLILMSTQGFSQLGTLFAATSGLGFALYSEASKRLQQEQGMIRARYPAYLFWLGAIGFTLSLALLPWTQLTSYTLIDLVRTLAFICIFSILPYVLFFEYMRRVESQMLLHSLPYVSIATILGEAIVLRSLEPLWIIPLCIFLLWEQSRIISTRGSEPV